MNRSNTVDPLLSIFRQVLVKGQRGPAGAQSNENRFFVTLTTQILHSRCDIQRELLEKLKSFVGIVTGHEREAAVSFLCKQKNQ